MSGDGQTARRPYSPSPRPTFEGPALIPAQAVTRHIWGDETSGEVADWIFASTDRIHCLVFGLAPGGSFTHSREYRTVFGADEVLTVLSGTLVLANPEVGEVQRVETGQSVTFGAGTWHHAFATLSIPSLAKMPRWPLRKMSPLAQHLRDRRGDIALGRAHTIVAVRRLFLLVAAVERAAWRLVRSFSVTAAVEAVLSPFSGDYPIAGAGSYRFGSDSSGPSRWRL